MLQFREYLPEVKEPLDISEEDIDKMISDLQWEDIEDLYDEEDFVKEELQEAISASERLKMAQRTRARKAMLAISRKIKLKRPSAMPVLKRRSQLSLSRTFIPNFTTPLWSLNSSYQIANSELCNTILTTYIS